MSNFVPGDRVGVLVGVQTGTPHIGFTGTVVKTVELWRNQPATVVVADDNGDELLYEPFLLTALPA